MSILEEPITADAITFRLGPDSAGIQMTPDEFDAIDDYDDNYRYELIHGVLVVSPFATRKETGPNDRLGHLLFKFQEEHPNGRVLNHTYPEHYVKLPNSRRRCDRAIWAGFDRQPDCDEDPATVLAEFVSAGKRAWRRDYEEKRDEYLALKVSEYWIIDRFRRTMTVYKKQGDKFIEIIVKENEIYKTDLLPGFELPLAYLLKAADEASD